MDSTEIVRSRSFNMTERGLLEMLSWCFHRAGKTIPHTTNDHEAWSFERNDDGSFSVTQRVTRKFSGTNDYFEELWDAI